MTTTRKGKKLAEPSSSAVAGGIVIATGTVTLTGSFLGLQYDALLFGLCGGMFSLMFLPPDSPTLRSTRSTACMLIAAAFFGALLSPAAAPIVHSAADWTSKIPAESLRLAAAGVIGLVFQFAVPLGLRWVQGRASA